MASAVPALTDCPRVANKKASSAYVHNIKERASQYNSISPQPASEGRLSAPPMAGPIVSPTSAFTVLRVDIQFREQDTDCEDAFEWRVDLQCYLFLASFP